MANDKKGDWQRKYTLIDLQAAEIGAGELPIPLSGVGAGVPPSPLMPLSLMALLSSFILESALEPVESLLTSSRKLAPFGGA